MQIPQNIAELIRRLEEAGFSAYAVGGAVRDALRGVEASDWDLATSALPEETCRVFSDLRTVPTGLAHGTVTVLSGGEPVEITTFRSDGEYSDHRHPEGVRFGCSLEEDLARRDFTVNAIAYSPVRGFVDPFGGREDIEEEILRCVGDPHRRFEEDALRILRALRFSSVLGYSIEKRTSRALRERLKDLRLVSAERICREFSLLLMGKNAKTLLGEYPELFRFLVPELAHREEDYRRNLSLIRERHSFWLRLALFLTDPLLSPEENAFLARKVLKRLKFKNEDLGRVERILCFGKGFPAGEVDRMLLLGKHPADFFDFVSYYCSVFQEREEELISWTERCRSLGRPLSLAQLALNGTDLMAEGFRGAEIARVLNTLLRLAAAGELENEKEALLSRGREIKKSDSP